MEQYEYLKTITFYVNPDQLSLLITGAEYHNASASHHPVTAVYGSGCGQLAAVFDDFDTPKATIGGTDIAMRPYLVVPEKVGYWASISPRFWCMDVRLVLFGLR